MKQQFFGFVFLRTEYISSPHMPTSLTTLICIVATVVSVLSAASNAGVAHLPAASKKGAVFRGGAAAAILDDRVDQITLESIIVPSEKAQTFIRKSSGGTTRRRLYYYFSVYGASGGCREEWSEGWDCEERRECFNGGNLICAGNYYRSGSSCSCSRKRSCSSSQYQTSAGSGNSDRTCQKCQVCGVGQRVETSCGGTTPTSCTPCAECEAGKWRHNNVNVQIAGGCQYSGTKKVSSNEGGKWICKKCRDCPGNQYRIGGCSRGDDANCGACTQCDAGKYRSDGCITSKPTMDSVCTTCTACAAGKFRSGGCSGTTDSQCQLCPEGKFAFGTDSSSCDGILVKDVRVKQFDEATKKIPIWKDIPAGVMGSVEKAMYAEEAVLSFSMPTGSLWTELRVYCSKGEGKDQCDTGTNGVWFFFFFIYFFPFFFFFLSCAHPFFFLIFFLGVATYTEQDSDGGFYFTCTKATIMQSDRPCQCNGIAGFAASGSHEDCGKWGDSENNFCLLNDGNCKDPITGGSPEQVAGGRFKAQCNPSASLSDRPLCSADPSSSNRIYGTSSSSSSSSSSSCFLFASLFFIIFCHTLD